MRNEWDQMVDFVSLLGVKGGPAIRPGSNMPTSTLIHINGKNFLVDTGLGVSRSICDQGVELHEIDAIFITHMHSDHYLELGPLIHTAWVSGRVKPIPIYGPKRLKHYWRAFLESMVDDIALRIEDEGRIDLEKLTAFYSFEDIEALIFFTFLLCRPPSNYVYIKTSINLKALFFFVNLDPNVIIFALLCNLDNFVFLTE